MLEVHQLHLWRGDRHLLKALDFTLPAGELLQLLWPNGLGKTSLLRCIAGFLHAEEGEVRWNGRAVKEDRDAFHWDLAYLGHESGLKGDLTARENLRFACALRAREPEARADAALEQVGLGALDPRLPVRFFSAGQKRRVSLARLSMWGAKLWLLDEPTSNLDAGGQAVFESLLKSHLDNGGAALVATHQVITLQGSRTRQWRQPQELPA